MTAASPEAEAEVGQLITQLRVQIAELELQLGQQAARFERWKERATEKLHAEADAREYCSEFDDVMEELGLPRRDKDWDVTVTVHYRTTVTVSAINSRDARNRAMEQGHDDLKAKVREELEYQYFDDVLYGDAEPTDG